jgi:hypothetical protein
MYFHYYVILLNIFDKSDKEHQKKIQKIQLTHSLIATIEYWILKHTKFVVNLIFVFPPGMCQAPCQQTKAINTLKVNEYYICQNVL